MTDRPKTPSVAASRLRPVRVARIIAWAAAVTAATAAGMARLASADEAAPKPEPVVPWTSVTAPIVQAAPLPTAPATGLVIIRHEGPRTDRPAGAVAVTQAPPSAPAPPPAPAPAPAPSTQSSGS